MNRRWGTWLGAGGVLTALAAQPIAAAPVVFSVETNVRLGYDLNPFLQGGSDLATGYVAASIAPRMSKKTEKGEINLTGHYDRTEYLKHYGSSDQYGAELDANQKLSSKLSVFAGLRYDSSVIGQDGNDDVTGAPIDDTDVNLIGLRRRAETYQARGGWEYKVSPKDTISADAGYTDTRYDSGPAGADSRNIGGRIGWRHAISERTRIGVSGSAYRIDYDTPGLVTWIMEPAVTFSTELSPTWHFDAQLGMSFSKLYLPLIPDQRASGLSGNLNLCHKGLKDNFCLYAARSVTGSGAGGTVERSQIGVNYSRRLTEALSWSGTASYARSASQTGAIGTREYINARGGLDWRVARWLVLGAEGRYRDVFGTRDALGKNRQIRADIGGEVNATISLPGQK